ncbi:MAG: glycoside hydrolase family 127 protein [Fimbriimonadales bacterium]|nr:glycoside hydrolase family 127 protein [Fimbriimonadales bacterium]
MVMACLALAVARPAVEPFDLADVRLTGGPFLEAQKVHADYLKRLEPDRLLARFRERAGLKPKAQGYGGWEAMGVSGHSLGHYLSAISAMGRATGDPEFHRRVRAIVDELAECQKARGTGYVAAIPDEERLWNEIRRGEIRSQGFDLNGVWVPWYTLHKLFAGLLDAHRLAGSRKALQVARGLADWAIDVTRNLTDEQWQRMLACEHGGMNESLAELYARTKDVRYLQLARKFHHRAILDPLAAGRDILPGKHANTQFPKLLGLATLHNLTGEPSDRKAVEFFWQTVVRHHTYAIGGNSDHEYFGPPDRLADRLSTNSCETCNTYNMLKLTQRVFEWRPSAEAMDYAERALWNHMLASTNYEDGGVTYYVSLQPGTARSYNRPFSDFTCCVGTGMENHARYGWYLYGHEGGGRLYVHQFVPSTLRFRQAALSFRLDADLPRSGRVRLTVTEGGPRRLEVLVRHPAWAKAPLRLLVNGREAAVSPQAGAYVAVAREWRAGDVLQFDLPLEPRIEPTPDNPNRFAVLYGPVVLAADLGRGPALERIPVLVTGGSPVSEWLRRQPGSQLSFRTVAVGRPEDLTLRPFYELVHERTIVYFDGFTEAQWVEREEAYRAEERRKAELAARTVDELRIGEMQPERDHGLTGENTSAGEAMGRKWRHATDGGWFEFALRVDPQIRCELLVTYWGADSGGREFDILVDGAKVATERLDGRFGRRFVDVAYPIPAELTQGKDLVRVRFAAHPGRWAGGVFGVRLLRSQ